MIEYFDENRIEKSDYRRWNMEVPDPPGRFAVLPGAWSRGAAQKLLLSGYLPHLKRPTYTPLDLEDV